MSIQPDPNEIARSLRLFVGPGDIGEGRIIGKDSDTPFGFYFSHEQIDLAAASAAEYSRTAKGVYVVMNQISDDLKNRPKLTELFKLTCDADIVRRKWLLIDLDPSSPDRTREDSATDAEKEAARLKMIEVDSWLSERGWPVPVVADSGNGWHILFALDLPNDESTKQLITRLLHALAKRFSSDQVAVDVSVHNASRITKCYGTPARKGIDRPDRPHRLSKLLSVPDNISVVTADQITEATKAALTESEQPLEAGSLFDRAASPPPNNNGNLEGFTPDKPKFVMPDVFPVGGRHDTLLKVAGAVRSFGANETEILDILRTFNRTRCNGGKPDEELVKIARDYATKDVNASMKALIEAAMLDSANGSNATEQLRQTEQRTRLRHALESAARKLSEGGDLAAITLLISNTLGEFSPQADPTEFTTWSMEQLDAADFSLEYLVDDVLVADQPCVIAAAKKSLKTNIACDLTLSLASQCPFLGKFYVPKPVRVALMTGESGDAVIQETLRRIARSKPWINLRDYTNAVCSFELPRLGQPTTTSDLKKFIADNALRVLIIDPAYLCLDLSDDAGNLFVVGKKLRELTAIGHETGCTVVIIHHTRKSSSDPFAIPELESIAWSGFQEWARQWLLIGRREAYNAEQAGSHKLWLNVGGSAGHSGCWSLDIEEGSRKDKGGRRWDVEVCNASEAIAENVEQNLAAKESRQTEREAKQLARDAEKLKRAYSRFPNGETAKAIREAAGMSSQKFGPANAVLIDDGEVVAIGITKNGHTYSGFKLTDSTETTGTRPGLDRDCPGSPGDGGRSGTAAPYRGAVPVPLTPADDVNDPSEVAA